jgi:hypothetical protein
MMFQDGLQLLFRGYLLNFIEQYPFLKSYVLFQFFLYMV